jgi:hypothetical protein
MMATSNRQIGGATVAGARKEATVTTGGIVPVMARLTAEETSSAEKIARTVAIATKAGSLTESKARISFPESRGAMASAAASRRRAISFSVIMARLGYPNPSTSAAAFPCRFVCGCGRLP